MIKECIKKIDEILLLSGENKRFGRVMFVLKFIERYLMEFLAYFCPSNTFRVFCYRNMGVKIGNGVYVGNYVIFDRIFSGMVSIGDFTSIGDRCIITAHANIPSNTPLRLIYPRCVKKTMIGNGVWIMPNCVVAPGVIIGDYAVVATGSVVTKDIPGSCLAGGVPAKVLKNLMIPGVSPEANDVKGNDMNNNLINRK